MRLISIGYLSLFFLLSCGESSVSEQKRHDMLRQRGAEISAHMASVLVARLSGEIQERGEVGAIAYCSEHALAITDSIATRYGVIIQRLSHRYRNPNNAANGKELKIIEHYRQQLAANTMPQPLVYMVADTPVYYAPLLVSMPLCLKCHGQPDIDIQMETLQALQQLYPDDRATGFALGDLRGLWKITFPPINP